MKATRYLGILLLFGLLFVACDKVEPPYILGIDCDAGTKKVLIEDYTGHGCVNCPGAAVVSEDLHEQCPDRIIVMAVHAGYFAGTEDFGPLFHYDFTTEAGDTWNDYYQVIGNPKGMINRADGGSGVVVVPDKWDKYVTSELALFADVELEVTASYNETDNKVNASVSGQFLSELNDNFKLIVCITENEIIKPQKNIDAEIGDVPYIEDYHHQHVLRASMNGNWGQEIASGAVSVGQKFDKSYSYDLGSDWVPEELHIVAFVYQDSDNYILQVEEAAVIE